MHLKNQTPHMKEAETLHGIYVWAALVSTERALSVMLGRPCMVNEHDCSAPVPLPVDKKDRQSSGTPNRPRTQNTAPSESRSANWSSSGLSATLSKRTLYETEEPSMWTCYFYHYLKLNRLSQKVVADLYNPYVRQLKWVCFLCHMLFSVASSVTKMPEDLLIYPTHLIARRLPPTRKTELTPKSSIGHDPTEDRKV